MANAKLLVNAMSKLGKYSAFNGEKFPRAGNDTTLQGRRGSDWERAHRVAAMRQDYHGREDGSSTRGRGWC